ncbi:uncharacterized protein LOC128883507 isoform X2 [Hylaeus volcanicus]|uniref:uncharacterized protein LOC128883507 isoform X2 n=1 Tax=Hylaeus volcanicus TaxID=313075 RepID=UPI0023B78BA5|nr:uncharacterized protein LOC128883507 isoform X2 [Hylaeus volcanicus]
MTSSNVSCGMYPSSNEPLRKKSRRGLSFRPNLCTRTRQHLCSIPLTETLTSLMMDALTLLKRRDRFKIFHQPVDVNLVPEYLTIVEHPMDFSKIEFKIQNGDYMNFSDMSRDVDLIFSNCKRFNATNTIFFKQAVSISLWWKKLKQQYQERAYTEHHSSIQSIPSSIPNVAKTTPNDFRDQTNTSKQKPVQLKRRRLPYVKCKYKCIPPRDTPLSLGDILQHYGEKGIIQNFLQADNMSKIFFFFTHHLVSSSKLKLLSIQNFSSSTITVLKNDKKDCEKSQPEVYSSLIQSITKFLGPNISHILAPELPSVQNFFFQHQAQWENPVTKQEQKQEQQEVLPKVTPFSTERTKIGSGISSEQLLPSYGDPIRYSGTTYGSVQLKKGNSFTYEASQSNQVAPTPYW